MGSLIKKVTDHRFKMNDDKNLTKKWQKERRKDLIIDNPTTENLKENTPEYIIISFFKYINEENFGTPVNFLPEILKKDNTKGKLAGNVKEWFEGIYNIKIQRIKINDIGSARSDIEVLLNYEYDQIEYQYEEKLTVIYESKGEPENRLVEGGQWVIMHLGGLSSKMKLQRIKI